MLSCLNLQCERGWKVLFSGVGFTLLPGCLLLIKGPNGSGKSSLLKIIAGVLKPSDGSVFYDRKDGILYLGHKNAIKPELSVRDNVLFWCRMYDTMELGDVALHYFGLHEIADMPCGELSAGWQRKVALTRLITVPAALWLLDEPLTHLDEDGGNRVAALIESKCENGGIVLMATHQEALSTRSISININEYSVIYNAKD